jgi:hypothetical protein
MDEAVVRALADDEAYAVGGAVRDSLLGRPQLDIDIACRRPERAARSYRAAVGGAVFLLSGRHGAWRVALSDGRTVDFTELRGSIEDDLSGRDFTINAIAVPARGGDPIDPYGGRRDLEARRLRAVSPSVFREDPLRLLRAVRLEEELGLRLAGETEALVRRDAGLVTRPAGERILAELLRLSARGYLRLAELGLLEGLGGSTGRLPCLGDMASPRLLLVAVLGGALFRLPISNELRRYAMTLLAVSRPSNDSPREIHRFRRATEPWALDALAFLGASELAAAVEAARDKDTGEPLVRGDELGLPPGPEVGRLLALIAEEQAAGTIETREDALALIARERRR